MNAALTYEEPHRLSAGVLALLVHLAFFAVLYFGVRWQSRPNEEFMVEMWASLPDAQVAPAPAAAAEPPPPARVVAPASPPVKADIEMRDKKHRKAELKEKQAKQQAQAKAAAAAKARQEAAELKELEAYSDRIRQAEQARVRAEENQATQVQVERYQDMIRNKIRRKIVKMDVPDTIAVVFRVTLLPDGMLMDDPVLVKSSGNPAYDDNVARAIMSSEPLPVPADPALQKMFRVLNLTIRPQ